MSQTEIALVRSSTPAEKKWVDESDRSIQVPFELVSNLIWFEAEVDGRPVNLILDTGAPTMLLNQLVGEPSKSLSGQTIHGDQVRLSETSINSLRLDGLDLGRQQALGMDLSGMEGRAGRELSGMIGYDQLCRYELMIDYQSAHFQLLNRSQIKARTEKPLYSAPIRLIEHLPAIQLDWNGQQYWFVLDSGASSNLISEQALEQGGDFTPSGEQIRLIGLDNRKHLVDLQQLDGLKLQEKDLSALAFAATSFQDEQGESLPFDGLLGQPFFQQFRISIDYRGRQIHFWQVGD